MRRPNFLFILSDDHAAHAISSYGSVVNETPHLDRIAEEGIRFTDAACTNATCSPSRASILTGTHSHVNGVTTLWPEFDSAQPSFPAILQAAGYRTALFGKWHLGHGPGHDPVGFDEWEVLPGQGDYYDPTFLQSGGKHVRTGYVTDILTDLALGWLDRQADDEPWCLLLWHKAPHRSWEPGPNEIHLFDGQEVPVPETYFDDYAGRGRAAHDALMRVARDLTPTDLKEDPPAGMSERERALWCYQRYMKDYLRCVAGIDTSTGRLLDALDARNDASDTVVMYSSDQGFYLGDHGWYDKRFMYRQSLQMPLIVRYPREIPAGLVRDELVLNIDFAQTFLDYAGENAPARMQGRSMRALMRGETVEDWRDGTYYRYWEHLSLPHKVEAHIGVRTKRYKLIHYYGTGLDRAGTVDELRAPYWELFDLDLDPDELTSIYDDAAYRPVRIELTERLLAGIADSGDTPPPTLEAPYAAYRERTDDLDRRWLDLVPAAPSAEPSREII